MRVLVTICAAFVTMPALGQEAPSSNSILDAKYFASVGLFAPDRKVRLGLDASVNFNPNPAPYVDFSETFDYRSSDETFSAEFGWNFGEKWQFRGQYFRVDDNQRVALEEDVEWGDYVFNAGTSVGAGTDMQITRFFFGRRFWTSGNREAGLGFGGHFLDLTAHVRGNATINGQDVGFVQERASVSQPLPNIGGWIRRIYSERWVVNARLDWLAASVGKYDGHIINASFGVGYNLTNHFGIGLSYNLFEIDLGVDDSDWRGRIRSRFQGPFVALNAYW